MPQAFICPIPESGKVLSSPSPSFLHCPRPPVCQELVAASCAGSLPWVCEWRRPLVSPLPPYFSCALLCSVSYTAPGFCLPWLGDILALSSIPGSGKIENESEMENVI